MPASGWHITVATIIVLAAGVVTLGFLARHRTGRELIPWTLAFLLSVAVASSKLQATSMTNYRSHMLEHLFVILVIAPLVASGLRLRLSRSAATGGLLAFTVLVPLYHLTRVGSWVMQQSGGHVVELVSFVVVGTWFWLPVYGANGILTDLQRITFTFIALPVIATTGLVLWSSNSSSLGMVGMSMPDVSVSDVRGGGIVMVEWGSALMVAHLLLLFIVALLHRRERLPVGYKYAEM
jgi:cytochrome c oxidase assembly factor CtaG